ncbi:MAG: Holliday junction resolvase RuvX, partial [Candidatus Desantisbacteria bacterium]
DERLSTKQVERICGSGKKHRGIIDKLAAQVILQTFLDRRQLLTKLGNILE